MLAPQTPQKLLELLKSPDSVAWGEFFRTYWNLLVSWARMAGLSPADAEEIAQQTLISVSRQMPTFEYDRAKGRFHHYLRRALKRKMIDHFKQIGRRPQHVSLMDYDAAEDDPAEAIAEDDYRRDAMRRLLECVTRELGEGDVNIFVEYFIQRQPAKKIAERIGIPSGHVANRAWKVRRRLIELAAEEGTQE